MVQYLKSLESEVMDNSLFEATREFLPFVLDNNIINSESIAKSISTASPSLKPKLIRIKSTLRDPSILGTNKGAGIMLISYDALKKLASEALEVCLLVYCNLLAM
jgi:hypothetical protein